MAHGKEYYMLAGQDDTFDLGNLGFSHIGADIPDCRVRALGYLRDHLNLVLPYGNGWCYDMDKMPFRTQCDIAVVHTTGGAQYVTQGSWDEDAAKWRYQWYRVSSQTLSVPIEKTHANIGDNEDGFYRAYAWRYEDAPPLPESVAVRK